MAVQITLIPFAEFHRVRTASMDRHVRFALLADMSRANTLAAVKRAGSGHLGSSFSALDLVTILYEAEMNTVRLGLSHPDRDVYFSSKGHDVPGQYAVLYSLGLLPQKQLLTLRRWGGPCGHPDVGTPGIEANSGSLGMGISKAKGIALAKRLQGRGGRVFVMTGDGELQEGQIYEALQTAAHQGLTTLTVIVDRNTVQSDKPVSAIIDLRDLEAKFRAFGWHVARCDGHDLPALEQAFTALRAVTHQPKILIADTIKGRGVSFMEHPAALKAGAGYYRWHAGAPDDASYEAGYRELIDRISDRLRAAGLAPLTLEEVSPEPMVVGGLPGSLAGEPASQGAQPVPPRVSDEYVVEAFGQALVELAGSRSDVVVLDADLAADCRVRAFELKHPERFVENGIAEQDMVSMAGGLALQGMLPVVNSFASFLAARANEQLYNNACERTRIIYVHHYAGLIPAGPGPSHQSLRDIALLATLPNVEILQPCNAAETRMAVAYCLNETRSNCVLRLAIGPSPRRILLPSGYRLSRGRGVTLADGADAVLFAYGPVMLHEALLAHELLAQHRMALKVVNMPWLNGADVEWLSDAVSACPAVFVLEDHAPVGGLGDYLLNVMVQSGLLQDRGFAKFGVEGLPAWGTPAQALRAHRLDGASLAERVMRAHSKQPMSRVG